MSARTLAGAGSIASAAASSACCWLPLVAIATGASAAGAATFFERYRVLFLAGAVLFLAMGFYLEYRKKPACAPDGSCPTPNRRRRRANRVLLWVSTAAVAALALFPSYVGRIAATAAGGDAGGARRLTLSIEGMTCGGCEASVEAALAGVRGVIGADASYERGSAVVTLERGADPSRLELAAAVGKAGYTLASPGEPRSPVDTTRVSVLSTDATEIRERFNGDVDRTRLLLLLSPT